MDRGKSSDNISLCTAYLLPSMTMPPVVELIMQKSLCAQTPAGHWRQTAQWPPAQQPQFTRDY